ncbi:response regulator transcription factor [Fusibacter ferrireducens]|uniref:Stage 0 sporulation protein A homolog n=1 Tax=Fusibacter ferrireducens TaxID=2785058 RepID=A0ABR9ZWY4_9FIRM|nr:response regulator transcription factor [Fusibacter ferrireducens]MBF4694977.1 response regulator transcription factor [Fusibacter ferrireducens]
MPNILIVEDEKNIADALSAYLESHEYRTIIDLSGLEARHIINRQKIDLILLDLMLPEVSGEALCKSIRAFSDVPIIMLTAKIDESDIINGLKIGADDYIIKPFSLKQVLARIEAVLRRSQGKIGNDAFYYDDGTLIIDEKGHEIYRDSVKIKLTPNEFKILLILAKSANKVFTRDELIELVMGKDFEGYDRAVDSHIKNIRLKIEADSKLPVYITTVHGVGYKFK